MRPNKQRTRAERQRDRLRNLVTKGLGPDCVLALVLIALVVMVALLLWWTSSTTGTGVWDILRQVLFEMKDWD